MATLAQKIFRWFFVYDFPPDTWNGMDIKRSRDSPSERWRLLCWTILCLCLWSNVEMTWCNFAVVVVCMTFLFFIAHFATCDPMMLTVSLKSLLTFIVVISFLNAVPILMSHPMYLSYEYLVKKMVLKEYHLLRFWCPDTYLMVLSITGITCVIRHLPRRFLNQARKMQGL